MGIAIAMLIFGIIIIITGRIADAVSGGRFSVPLGMVDAQSVIIGSLLVNAGVVLAVGGIILLVLGYWKIDKEKQESKGKKPDDKQTLFLKNKI